MKLETNLPPLQIFVPPIDVAEKFVYAANGKGLDRFSRWLMQALYNVDAASDLMAEAVEGGLIATFRYLRRDGQHTVTMFQTDEIVLKQAIARRIPRVPASLKQSLATRLVDEMKLALALGRILLIDGAAISVVDGRLIAQINKSRKQQTIGTDAQKELLAA